MKELNDKFKLIENKGEVSIIYEDDVSNENLLVFCVDFEDNYECASHLAYELQDIVYTLNWQDKELRKAGVI